MDQQPVLIKRPCQKAHQRGQEEVIAVCLNKDCRQRLCCINCRKDGDHQGHLGDICHFDFLSDQLEEEFTAYKSVGILSLIEGKIQEFNKVKAEFLKAFDLLETDFLKRVQRVREVDLLIRESIKMVETKVFELFTEIQSQALVELKDNSFVERLKRLICEDPLISELQQLNTELVSKIQATKIAKFIQKRSSDPLQVECFFQNSLSFDQIPIEMKLIIEERIEETNEGNQFFLGGFQSNLKNGRGILVKQDCQEIIEGIWENDSIKWGIKLGKSKINQNINYHYVGMLQNDNREGKGITKYSTGSSYEGDWKNDKREGKGIFKDSNGNSYEGDWKNDKKEGKGIYKGSNGNSYEGDWKNDKREGKGIYKDSNGNSYEGDWKNDKKEGKGIYKDSNGNSYEGDWKNDKREGKGIYKGSNGNSYEGDWKNDKREGKGIYKGSNGNSYEGDWKNDKKEGKGIYKGSNGDIEEGHYQDGLSIGEHKVHKPNSTKPYKIKIYGQDGKLQEEKMLE